MRVPAAARSRRIVPALLLCAVLAAAPAAGSDPVGRADSWQRGREIHDVAVLRPLGFVQTLVSAAAFAVFYPISLLTGGSDDVVEICIEQPIAQTFEQPIADVWPRPNEMSMRQTVD